MFLYRSKEDSFPLCTSDLSFKGNMIVYCLYDEGEHSGGMNGLMRLQDLDPGQQVFIDGNTTGLAWGGVGAGVHQD